MSQRAAMAPVIPMIIVASKPTHNSTYPSSASDQCETAAAIRQPGCSQRECRKQQKRVAKVQTEKENPAGRFVLAHMVQQDKSASQHSFIRQKRGGECHGIAGPVAFDVTRQHQTTRQATISNAMPLVMRCVNSMRVCARAAYPEDFAIATRPLVATACTRSRGPHISSPKHHGHVATQGGPCKASDLQHLSWSKIGQLDGRPAHSQIEISKRIQPGQFESRVCT